jgi:GNAT superfamily N-acetyltransferase
MPKLLYQGHGSFRPAERADCALILSFIRQLAEYEHMENDVVATEELLAEWLFDKSAAEVLFAVADGQEVAFALFFPNFSTFLGRPGMYLEDIYVLPEYRGRGIGKAMLRELARIAVERGYGRFEWACLDWNTPGIEFYRSLGAEQMSEWTTHRLSGDKMTELASEDDRHPVRKV